MTNAQTIETVKLRNRRTVLAKTCQFGTHPVRYQSNKQAAAKVQQLQAQGINAYFCDLDRIKYVYISE